MAVSPWQRRIQRAQQLAGQYPFVSEMLGFYIRVARFQEDLHRQLSAAFSRHAQPAAVLAALSPDQRESLSSRFDSFLSMAEAHGPKALSELSSELRARGSSFYPDLLQHAWSTTTNSPADAPGLLAIAFLQPYAELWRPRGSLRPVSTAHALCPFRLRKPGFGLLRQMGDGGARSMVCSFCLAEWDFRRIICPGCGEENNKNLPVFTASEFDYIRVECCDACKTYIKSIDLTKNGRAEPPVDELASAPLDLWAREHGYTKLQSNLLGM